MTRKHFELFAAMLYHVPSNALRLEFAATLIPVLKESNPNFKEAFFRKAANCQIDRKGCYIN